MDSSIDLNGGQLAGADLVGKDLSGADLSGADLSYAFLNAANLSGADLTGANLRNAIMVQANLGGANFTRADLTGADLRDSLIPNVVLTEAILEKTILEIDCEHREEVCGGIRSGGIKGVPASLPHDHGLVGGWLLGPRVNLPGVNLEEQEFSNSLNLSYANFQGANFRGADLEGAWLSETNFTGADLTGANLSFTTAENGSWDCDGPILVDATLRDANCYRAMLLKSDLRGSTLFGSDLRGVQLSETNLDGVDLSRSEMHGAIGTGVMGRPKGLPSGWVLAKGVLVGPGALIWKDTDLSGQDLRAVDLTDIRALAGANFEGARLPSGWDFVNGVLVDPMGVVVSEPAPGASPPVVATSASAQAPPKGKERVRILTESEKSALAAVLPAPQSEGWHPDPLKIASFRWWNGSQWTGRFIQS